MAIFTSIIFFCLTVLLSFVGALQDDLNTNDVMELDSATNELVTRNLQTDQPHVLACNCHPNEPRCVDTPIKVLQDTASLCFFTESQNLLGSFVNLEAEHASVEISYVKDKIKTIESKNYVQRNRNFPASFDSQINAESDKRRALLILPGAGDRQFQFVRSWKAIVYRHMTIAGDINVRNANGDWVAVPFSVAVPMQAFRLNPFLHGDSPWVWMICMVLTFFSYVLTRMILLTIVYAIIRRNKKRRGIQQSSDDVPTHDDGGRPTLGAHFGVRPEDMMVVAIQPTAPEEPREYKEKSEIDETDMV